MKRKIISVCLTGMLVMGYLAGFPAMLSADGNGTMGNDIKEWVDVELPSLYRPITQSGEPGAYFLERGIQQVNAGTGQEEILTNDLPVVLEYEWSVKPENMIYAQSGAYFRIPLLNSKHFQPEYNEGRWEPIISDEKDPLTNQNYNFGRFKIESGTLTAVLDDEVQGKHELKGGRFRIRYKAQGNTKVRVLASEDGENVDFVITEVDLEGNYCKDPLISADEIADWDAEERYIRSHVNKIKKGNEYFLGWVVRVGEKVLYHMVKENPNVEFLQNTWMEDVLPKGLELIENSMKITANIHGVTRNRADDGSEQKMLLAHKVIATPKRRIENHQILMANEGESYEQFKSRIYGLQNMSPLTVAYFPPKGEESARILVYLGDLGADTHLLANPVLPTEAGYADYRARLKGNALHYHELDNGTDRYMQLLMKEKLDSNELSLFQVERIMERYLHNHPAAGNISNYEVTFQTTAPKVDSLLVNQANLEWANNKTSTSNHDYYYQSASAQGSHTNPPATNDNQPNPPASNQPEPQGTQEPKEPKQPKEPNHPQEQGSEQPEEPANSLEPKPVEKTEQPPRVPEDTDQIDDNDLPQGKDELPKTSGLSGRILLLVGIGFLSLGWYFKRK